jgi:hypothetical protein
VIIPKPKSLGLRSPLVAHRNFEKIDEENSDNEGDGGNQTQVLGKNNYQKLGDSNQNHQ